MTRYNVIQRKNMATMIKGKKIITLEYVEEEDYYVVTLDDDSEFCFRYMADLI